MSHNMESMKEEIKKVSYASTVSGDLKKAVVSMEKSTKSNSGLIKMLPKTLAKQDPGTIVSAVYNNIFFNNETYLHSASFLRQKQFILWTLNI